MRAAFLAMAGVIVAFLYFLPTTTIEAPQDFEVYRNVGLIVLFAWLAVEAVVLSRRARVLPKSAPLAAPAPTLASAKAVEDPRVAQLTVRNEELTRSSDERGRALDDATAKLARVEQDLRDKVAKSADEEVVNLLALLQLKGRFIDFVMDDITRYPDAQVGAAARVVHQGCASVVREYFDIKPVYDGSEGAPLTLDRDYDSRRYRLLGRVTGEPPFKGRVLHRGWVTTSVRLPEAVSPEAHMSRGIIAPAEVELH